MRGEEESKGNRQEGEYVMEDSKIFKKKTTPVIFVTPPSTAAAPTIAYKPGVMQVAIDLPHDDSKMYQCGL